MYKKYFKLFKNPKLVLLYILNNKVLRIVPDSFFLKIKYRLLMGKTLNLRNPLTFNEKLQWLKLNDRNPLYTDLVDKHKVRDYIASKLGEEVLIPLLGVYNNFEDINFNELPNEFVLKPNHTSGDIYLCKNKSQIDYESLRETVSIWLNKEYYWIHREWPYKNIRPKILCEQYMMDKSEGGLKDYKFMCFNGKVRCSFVCLNRGEETGLNVDFYDRDWNALPFERMYPNSGVIIPKPINYHNMLKIAEDLAKGLSFVRVDFYEINGQLYFGELTFYPGSGFERFKPEVYDTLMGQWLELTVKKNPA